MAACGVLLSTKRCISVLQEVCELKYSKATSRPARWVLAVPEDSDVQKVEDMNGRGLAVRCIASSAEHPSHARKHLGNDTGQDRTGQDRTGQDTTGQDMIRTTGQDVFVRTAACGAPSTAVMRSLVFCNHHTLLPCAQITQVATELPRTTKAFFEERGVDVDIQFSWGTVRCTHSIMSTGSLPRSPPLPRSPS
eukprot:SAG11_NODE_5060_length_1676_cov_2.060875_2_plen_192_part_01